MEKYSVQAVLSAVDKNFTSNMKSATSWVDRLQARAGSSSNSMLGMGVAMGVASSVTQKAMSVVSGAVGGLVGDLNQGSATWKTFTGNMENMGKSKAEIASVKKELQDFATKTIYNASDMATTYSQLAAVGIKNTTQLVKGFGGLAAASAEPKQAMKTLSQQATQMAAKPMVQWQDFKLMLEQTPAGIAAVAKTMGMSTAELVKNVQDGTIKTQEFFDAVTETGTNDNFTNMATQYKDVGQALDGLKETLTGKLQPAFDKLSKIGIDAVSGLIAKVDEFDVSGIEKGIDNLISIIDHFTKGTEISANAMDMLRTGAEKVLPVVAAIGSGVGLSGMLPILGHMNQGFSFLTTKGELFGSTLSNVAGKGLEMSKGINLTNFAKGFESARSKLDGFKIGMIDASSVFGRLDSGFLKVGSSVTGLQDKFPKLTSAFSKVSSGIGSGLQQAASVGTTAMTGMVNGLTSVMSLALTALGPAAILGIALVGLGLVNTQFGTQIQEMINTAITKGPAIIQGLVAGITSQIPALMASGTQLLAQLAQMIAVNLPVIIQAGVDIINALVGGVTQNMGSIMTSALTIVESLMTSLLSAAPQLLMTGLNLLLSLVQGISSNSDKIVATATNIIKSFTENITNNLPQIISKGIDILVKLADGIVKTIPQLIPVAVQAITQLVSTLSANLPKMMDAAVKIINTLADGLISHLPEILSAGVELITTIVQAIAQNLPEIVGAGIEITAKLAMTLLQALPDMISAGSDLVAGFIQGIGDMIGGVVNKAAELASSAVDTVKSYLNIGSPSKVFRQMGKWTGEGFVIGMASMVKDVENQSEELAAAALPDMKSMEYDMSQSISGSVGASMSVQASNQPIIVGNDQPIYVTLPDGRVLAETTAPFMGGILQKQLDKATIGKGRRR